MFSSLESLFSKKYQVFNFTNSFYYYFRNFRKFSTYKMLVPTTFTIVRSEGEIRLFRNRVQNGQTYDNNLVLASVYSSDGDYNFDNEEEHYASTTFVFSLVHESQYTDERTVSLHESKNPNEESVTYTYNLLLDDHDFEIRHAMMIILIMRHHFSPAVIELIRTVQEMDVVNNIFADFPLGRHGITLADTEELTALLDLNDPINIELQSGLDLGEEITNLQNEISGDVFDMEAVHSCYTKFVKRQMITLDTAKDLLQSHAPSGDSSTTTLDDVHYYFTKKFIANQERVVKDFKRKMDSECLYFGYTDDDNESVASRTKKNRRHPDEEEYYYI